MNYKALIIDDHPAVRMAVRLILEDDGYNVVGEADDGEDALDKIDQLQPHLIILDIGLPKIDGLTIISQLSRQLSPVKIIVLTALESDHMAVRCMEIGAHGFVNKNKNLCELTNATRAIRSGYSYFPNRALTSIRPGAINTDYERLKSLSNRELRILQQLVQGLSNKQIAERMMLSSKTISTYKTRLLLKLNSSSLLDLYELAKRNGLTEF